MLHSMTGFGKASLDSNLGKISIELKSLNSKNIDINFNIPSLFKSMENDLRVVVSNKIKRGKIDCKFNLSLNFENLILIHLSLSSVFFYLKRDYKK